MLEGSILQRLAAACQEGRGHLPKLDYGVYYKNTLVALCHALEDCILTSNSSPVTIAAFQRGQWYLQEADRYGEIAKKADRVAILAVPEAGFDRHPTSQRDNVTVVSLDREDPVAQEWHLAIVSPTYMAMVLCQELSAAEYGSMGAPENDLERKFYGFWTFDPQLVLEATRLLVDRIGNYDKPLQHILNTKANAIAARLEENREEPDDLGNIVSRVVEYLRDSDRDLEAKMYGSASPYQKALRNNLTSNKLQAYIRMAQLADIADAKNPQAGVEVAMLCEMMGHLLDLPAWQIDRLRLASLFHRLDFLPEQARSFEIKPTEERISCCPLIPGVQVLRKMPKLRAIATIVNHQTEWWNGEGQPAGLSHDRIPLESRILGLMVQFQKHLRQFDTLPQSQQLENALEQCKLEKDRRWDPKLLEALSLLVMGMQQGLNLPVELPKASTRMWLLDDRFDAVQN